MEDFPVVIPNEIGIRTLEPAEFDGGSYQVDVPMLVDATPIASVVRLQSLDDCLDLIALPVIKHIAQPKGDDIGWSDRRPIDALAMLACFHIEIVGDYTRLRFAKSPEFVPEKFKVLVRPYLLGTDAARECHLVCSDREG